MARVTSPLLSPAVWRRYGARFRVISRPCTMPYASLHFEAFTSPLSSITKPSSSPLGSVTEGAGQFHVAIFRLFVAYLVASRRKDKQTFVGFPTSPC